MTDFCIISLLIVIHHLALHIQDTVNSSETLYKDLLEGESKQKKING